MNLRVTVTGEVEVLSTCAVVESYCMPYELNHREQKSLSRMETGILTEHVVYGRIPLMVTANCTQRTMEKCIKSAHMGENRLRDRYRKEFPVMLHCRYCYNVILNSVPDLPAYHQLYGYPAVHL